jgi:hypothetical protein
MSFEGPHFFRNTELFDVVKWWRGAAIVGALPLLGSFIAAILLLMRLKPLWHASEQQSAPPNLGGVDMAWLM